MRYCTLRANEQTLRANERKEFSESILLVIQPNSRERARYLFIVNYAANNIVCKSLECLIGKHTEYGGWTFIDRRNRINYGKSQSTFNLMSSGQMGSLF